ncbi:MAG: ABC transporter permease [Longimicrobiales bacterium]
MKPLTHNREPPLFGFVRKEVYHILRDRRTLAVLLLIPIVQVLLFGFAVRTDIESIRIAIVDPSPDAVTLALRARLAATELHEIVDVRRDPGGLDALFRRGDAHQALVFEPGFATRLARGLPAGVQLITDATEPNTASAREAFTLAVLRRFETDIAGATRSLAQAPARAPAQAILIDTRVRMRFNPTLESAHLFVPGLIAFVLTIVCALMTSISITREKELGTMEVLLVSPLRPWQIILGKVAPYLALGFGDALIVLLIARLVFDVPVRGSVTLLLLLTLIFVFVCLALGIFISTRTDSQRVAMIAALAGLMLPTMMLSGFIFPIESMPTVLQWLSDVVPAKWFLIAARGVMLKGAGLDVLWPQTLALLGFALVLVAISVRRFRVRLS